MQGLTGSHEKKHTKEALESISNNTAPFSDMECFCITLKDGVPKKITFTETVRMIRIKNTSVSSPLKVSTKEIKTYNDKQTSVVGIAPEVGYTNDDWFPLNVKELWICSNVKTEVYVEGYL